MSTPRNEPTGVRWSPPSGIGNQYTYPTASGHLNGERIVAWLVITLLLACAMIALYDAYLLLSGVQA